MYLCRQVVQKSPKHTYVIINWSLNIMHTNFAVTLDKRFFLITDYLFYLNFESNYGKGSFFNYVDKTR